jgi:hypothetical protein
MPKENAPQSVFQLVYVSAAAVPFGNDELDALLACSRENNASLDVTGILLFTDQTFFQVLEGNAEVVQQLYDKIEGDRRHNNVLLLAKREVERRNFGHWSMGFVCDRREIAELPGFIDFFSENANRTLVDLRGDSRRIRQILEGFRRGRWRREKAPA